MLQAVFNDFEEGDVVWCQDYHLMLLPALLKARHPKMKVSFQPRLLANGYTAHLAALCSWERTIPPHEVLVQAQSFVTRHSAMP